MSKPYLLPHSPFDNEKETTFKFVFSNEDNFIGEQVTTVRIRIYKYGEMRILYDSLESSFKNEFTLPANSLPPEDINNQNLLYIEVKAYSQSGQESDWSNGIFTKCYKPSKVEFLNLKDDGLIQSDDFIFIAERVLYVETEDIEQYKCSYRFDIFNMDGTLLESSGETESTLDISMFEYKSTKLKYDRNYYIVFTYTDNNGLISKTEQIKFSTVNPSEIKQNDFNVVNCCNGGTLNIVGDFKVSKWSARYGTEETTDIHYVDLAGVNCLDNYSDVPFIRDEHLNVLYNIYNNSSKDIVANLWFKAPRTGELLQNEFDEYHFYSYIDNVKEDYLIFITSRTINPNGVNFDELVVNVYHQGVLDSTFPLKYADYNMIVSSKDECYISIKKSDDNHNVYCTVTDVGDGWVRIPFDGNVTDSEITIDNVNYKKVTDMFEFDSEVAMDNSFIEDNSGLLYHLSDLNYEVIQQDLFQIKVRNIGSEELLAPIIVAVNDVVYEGNEILKGIYFSNDGESYIRCFKFCNSLDSDYWWYDVDNIFKEADSVANRRYFTMGDLSDLDMDFEEFSKGGWQ